MSKSKFIVDKLAKLFEQGLVSYKDLSSEDSYSAGADISGLSESPNVWFDDAYFKDDTGILLNDKK